MSDHILFKDGKRLKSPLPLGVRLPKISLPPAKLDELGLSRDATSYAVLYALCKEGEITVGINKAKNYREYQERLNMELEILEECGFVDYMLMNWDLHNFCRERSIPTGKGRGSAASSLILYLIGVTRIDPIEHGLIFERFVSRARAKKIVDEKGRVWLDGGLLADIDNDICLDRRPEVVDYIINKYGGNSTQMLTVGTLSSKSCIKECMKKVGGFTEEQTKTVSDSLPKVHGLVSSLKDAYNTSPEFKAFCDENPDVYNVALRLEGLKKNYGTHASGIAISNRPIDEIMPLQLDKDGNAISGYEMNDVAKMMVKFDILGLKTLTLIKRVCDMVGLDYTKLDYNDPFIYDRLNDSLLPAGLFQISAETSLRCIKKIQPENLRELSDIMAIARPGALQFISEYSDVKFGKKEIKKRGNKDIDKILEMSKGVVLYQETLMQIGHQVFKLTLEETESLRKAVGKKLPEKMAEFEEIIYKNAEKNGVKKEAADFFWQVCKDSANYSFNLSHSVCYAATAAETVFLKYKYPKEFFCCMLQLSANKPEQFAEIELVTQELPHFGIKLLPPDWEKSDLDFTVEGENIRYGLSSIKGVSEQTLQKIIDFREADKHDITDAFTVAKRAGLSIANLCTFTQAGLFDSLLDGNTRSYLVFVFQCMNTLTPKQREGIFGIYKAQGGNFLNIIKSCIDNGTRDANGKKIFIQREPTDSDMIARRKKLSEERDGVWIEDDEWKSIYKAEFEKEKAAKSLVDWQEKIYKAKEIWNKNKLHPEYADWYFERQVLGYSYSKKISELMEGEPGHFVNSMQFYSIKENTVVKMVGWLNEKATDTISKSKNRVWKFILNDDKGRVTCIFTNWKSQDRISKYLERVGTRFPIINDTIKVLGKKMGDAIMIDDFSIINEKIYTKFSEIE